MSSAEDDYYSDDDFEDETPSHTDTSAHSKPPTVIASSASRLSSADGLAVVQGRLPPARNDPPEHPRATVWRERVGKVYTRYSRGEKEMAARDLPAVLMELRITPMKSTLDSLQRQVVRSGLVEEEQLAGWYVSVKTSGDYVSSPEVSRQTSPVSSRQPSPVSSRQGSPVSSRQGSDSAHGDGDHDESLRPGVAKPGSPDPVPLPPPVQATVTAQDQPKPFAVGDTVEVMVLGEWRKALVHTVAPRTVTVNNVETLDKDLEQFFLKTSKYIRQLPPSPASPPPEQDARYSIPDSMNATVSQGEGLVEAAQTQGDSCQTDGGPTSPCASDKESYSEGFDDESASQRHELQTAPRSTSEQPMRSQEPLLIDTRLSLQDPSPKPPPPQPVPPLMHNPTEVRSAFSKYDSMKRGKIVTSDLSALLADLGMDASISSALQDLDNDGVVESDTFERWYAVSMDRRASYDEDASMRKVTLGSSSGSVEREIVADSAVDAKEGGTLGRVGYNDEQFSSTSDDTPVESDREDQGMHNGAMPDKEVSSQGPEGEFHEDLESMASERNDVKASEGAAAGEEEGEFHEDLESMASERNDVKATEGAAAGEEEGEFHEDLESMASERNDVKATEGAAAGEEEGEFHEDLESMASERKHVKQDSASILHQYEDPDPTWRDAATHDAFEDESMDGTMPDDDIATPFRVDSVCASKGGNDGKERLLDLQEDRCSDDRTRCDRTSTASSQSDDVVSGARNSNERTRVESSGAPTGRSGGSTNELEGLESAQGDENVRSEVTVESAQAASFPHEAVDQPARENDGNGPRGHWIEQALAVVNSSSSLVCGSLEPPRAIGPRVAFEDSKDPVSTTSEDEDNSVAGEPSWEEWSHQRRSVAGPQNSDVMGQSHSPASTPNLKAESILATGESMGSNRVLFLPEFYMNTGEGSARPTRPRVEGHYVHGVELVDRMDAVQHASANELEHIQAQCVSLQSHGRYIEALSLYGSGIMAMVDILGAAHSTVAEATGGFVLACITLANKSYDECDYNQTFSLVQRAMRHIKRIHSSRETLRRRRVHRETANKPTGLDVDTDFLHAAALCLEARVHMRRGATKKAIQTLRKQLQIEWDGGNTLNLVECLLSLSDALHVVGDFSQSVWHAQTALDKATTSLLKGIHRAQKEHSKGNEGSQPGRVARLHELAELIARAYEAIASGHESLDNLVDCENAWKDAIRHCRIYLGETHPRTLAAWKGLQSMPGHLDERVSAKLMDTQKSLLGLNVNAVEKRIKGNRAVRPVALQKSGILDSARTLCMAFEAAMNVQDDQAEARLEGQAKSVPAGSAAAYAASRGAGRSPSIGSDAHSLGSARVRTASTPSTRLSPAQFETLGAGISGNDRLSSSERPQGRSRAWSAPGTLKKGVLNRASSFHYYGEPHRLDPVGSFRLFNQQKPSSSVGSAGGASSVESLSRHGSLLEISRLLDIDNPDAENVLKEINGVDDRNGGLTLGHEAADVSDEDDSDQERAAKEARAELRRLRSSQKVNRMISGMSTLAHAVGKLKHKHEAYVVDAVVLRGRDVESTKPYILEPSTYVKVQRQGYPSMFGLTPTMFMTKAPVWESTVSFGIPVAEIRKAKFVITLVEKLSTNTTSVGSFTLDLNDKLDDLLDGIEVKEWWPLLCSRTQQRVADVEIEFRARKVPVKSMQPGIIR